MKNRNKFKLTQLCLLIATISVSSFSFADNAAKSTTKPLSTTEKTTEKANDTPLNNSDLSDLRKEIVAEQLRGQLADKKLETKKKEKEIESLQYQIDNPQSNLSNGNVKNTNTLIDPGMIAPIEDRIAKDKNMNQVVGFKYQQEEKKDSGAEVSGMLKELDQMIGKDNMESTPPAPIPFTVQKTFVEAKLDSLSIVGTEKKAKVKFIFLETNGTQKKKIAYVINAEEGKETKVNDKRFVFKSITNEGVQMVDLDNNQVIEASRYR